MKFKFSVNAAIQAIGTATQLANVASGFVPPSKQPLVASAVGLLQAASGLLAHFRNPDGTPAQVAYDLSAGQIKPNVKFTDHSDLH